MDKKKEEENFLKKDQQKAFQKLTDVSKKDLNPSEKVTLNRKGNQFFNEGKIDVARRIFITTGYSDGIARIGDYYYKQDNYIEALKMYILAPAPEKKDELIYKISGVIKSWLK